MVSGAAPHLGLQHCVLRLVVLQGVQKERRGLPHCVSLHPHTMMSDSAAAGVV